MQRHLQLQSRVQLFDIAFAINKFSFCGALFKRILAWERGISKRQNEIVPLLVIFHLPYSKYNGAKSTRVVREALVSHSCLSCNTRVAPVSHSCQSCLTRVTLLSLVLHPCYICVALVTLISLVSRTRFVNQTKSFKTRVKTVASCQMFSQLFLC